MSHEIADRQSELLRCPLYVANPVFLNNVRWQSDKEGKLLIEKNANCSAICTVVGRVLDRRLNCTADGNFISRQYGSLSSAKFQLLLSKPHGTPFADDFDVALNHVGKLQAQVAATKTHKNFVVDDALNKYLRFTQNVFIKRSPPIQPTTQSGDVITPSTVDDVTEHWPVRDDLRDDLAEIKYGFCASPLPVYDHDRYVEPRDVQDSLRGALVILQFELHHFYIGRSSFDSFNGTIEQIEILQPGEARPLSALKRKAGNLHDGPIRMRPPPQSQLGSNTPAPPPEPVAGPSTVPGCPSPSPTSLERAPVTEPDLDDVNATASLGKATTSRTTNGKGKQKAA